MSHEMPGNILNCKPLNSWKDSNHLDVNPGKNSKQTADYYHKLNATFY